MDYFLLEGVTVLFKAALGYFDVIEKTITNAKNFGNYLLMQNSIFLLWRR